MITQQWTAVLGVATSALMILVPWMLMVHGRLAVLAAKMAAVEHKVDQLIEVHEKRLPQCALHEAQLRNHQTQLEQVIQRLEELA